MTVKKIVFYNDGEIDPRAFTTFGLNAKESVSDAIGFFGTGLKYAISVLLRTDHTITIYSGLDKIEFRIKEDQFRGKDFNIPQYRIESRGYWTDLPFTLELGKTWEVWQAYRELASNALDEGGGVIESDATGGVPDKTIIELTGQPISEVFKNRHEVILPENPLPTTSDVEIRNTPSSFIYYKGIRANTLQKPSLYLYNIRAPMTLTEDRTIRDTLTMSTKIAKAVMESQDETFIKKIITAPDTTLESSFYFTTPDNSTQGKEVFLRTVETLQKTDVARINPSAVRVWQNLTKSSIAPTEIEMTKAQGKVLERAIEFSRKIGYPVNSYPIKVAESLGEGVLGMAHNGIIYIAERTFQLGGSHQVASTLIEEYVHLRYGYQDCTYAMQSYLFDRLVSMGGELLGDPL